MIESASVISYPPDQSPNRIEGSQSELDVEGSMSAISELHPA